MKEIERASLRIKFNAAYYLAKKERLFSDYPDLLTLHTKNDVIQVGKAYITDRACALFTDYIGAVTKESVAKDIVNARYYSVLSDGSTDSAVIEEELVYVLYLKEGTPKVKYLSIERPENADADGIKQCITKAFERFGIMDFSKKLLGLNLDGAAVNMGIHNGLGRQIKSQSPWLEVIHCFNHRLELAITKAFRDTSFSAIEEYLNQLYFIYQKSPKRLRELQRLSEAYGQSIAKPSKPYGSRWIDHKYRAMLIALENYGPFITHVESLSKTDSQATRRAELAGYLLKWKDASLPINMAIFLDILSPLRRLSLAFQQEIHNPVKSIRRVQELKWTMAKLQLLIEESLENPEATILTNYKKLRSDIIYKEDDDRYYYQQIHLARCEKALANVDNQYNKAIRNISAFMEERFAPMNSSPLFEHMVSMLEVKNWPTENIEHFGNEAVNAVVSHFKELLKNGGCNIDNVLTEWIILKTFVLPIYANDKKKSYLEIWKSVFCDKTILKDCRNILDVFELFLICPFTNAKLERMFSRMSRVKSEPSIDEWYDDKIR